MQAYMVQQPPSGPPHHTVSSIRAVVLPTVTFGIPASKKHVLVRRVVVRRAIATILVRGARERQKSIDSYERCCRQDQTTTIAVTACSDERLDLALRGWGGGGLGFRCDIYMANMPACLPACLSACSRSPCLSRRFCLALFSFFLCFVFACLLVIVLLVRARSRSLLGTGESCWFGARTGPFARTCEGRAGERPELILGLQFMSGVCPQTDALRQSPGSFRGMTRTM